MNISQINFQVREYKVVLIGDAFVGKTSIFNQIHQKKINMNEAPTISVSYIQIPFEYDGREFRINLWDTAGAEQYQSLTPSYTRHSDAVIIVFDLSKEESFINSCRYFENIRETINPSALKVLCGNKKDLNLTPECSEYQKWCEENDGHLYTVSALTGDGITEMFNDIVKLLSDVGPLTERKYDLEVSNKSSNCSC